jgi:hypothetical protein
VSLRFLCDENLPRPIVDAIRAQGLDAMWVAAVSPGILDHAVLALAERERRVLITLDKDFGELAVAEAGAGCGIILLRPPLGPPAEAAARIATLIASRHDWAGHVSVIEPGRVRQRPLRKKK